MFLTTNYIFVSGERSLKLSGSMILLLFLLMLPLSVKSQNEDFDVFIKKFSQDSIFQLSRITFPLTYISWDYEEDEEIITTTQKEQYKFDRLFYSLKKKEDAYPVFYDNFECKFQDSGERVFQWKGFYSMDRRYYFKRIEEEWFLIKILDYDPLE